MFFACKTDHIRDYVIGSFVVVGSQCARHVVFSARGQLVQTATRFHSAGGSTQRLRRVVQLYETPRSVADVFLPCPRRLTTYTLQQSVHVAEKPRCASPHVYRRTLLGSSTSVETALSFAVLFLATHYSQQWRRGRPSYLYPRFGPR